MKKPTFMVFAIIAGMSSVFAQSPFQDSLNLIKRSTQPSSEKKWYDAISLRGYMQIRYNRLLETNEKLKCESCDRSWGENGEVFLRRIRLVFSGHLTPRIYFYIQPDFGSSVNTTNFLFGQIRDAYVDLGLDDKNEFRLRLGQSKVPFGFENLQSSQLRLPLDRDDAINSGVPNERDLGAFFYWTPEAQKKIFSDLTKDGLKGSGDYGVFALGVYNGQTMDKPELNNSLHIVGRISYPININQQVIEPGIQAYTGQFVIASDQTSKGAKINVNRSFLDQRIAASLILHNKPIGFQAEYNFGKGPQFNPINDSIEIKGLKGGYVLVSYLIKNRDQTIIPFLRYQFYDGGKKLELDARSYRVKELEMGIEWQITKQLEFTTAYTFSSRRFEDFILQDNYQKGRLLRLQVQVNF